jgi:folate-binding protein YgfZ
MTGFWVDAPRDVLLVTGADALSYLQSQVSQDIRGLPDGGSTYSFVLQPTGKVDALVRIHRRSAESFVLDTDAGFGAGLMARLNRFKIRVAVEIGSVEWRTIAVRGVESVDGGVPAWGRDDAFDLLGPDVEPPAGVPAGDPVALERARIEAGWPALGREITDATIPAETGFVVPLAVSFTKGCYPGQELVERMDSRGSAAPRFVRRVRGAGSVEPGAALTGDGKTVGQITSVVANTEGWIGLALVARSVAPGDTVSVDGGPATVEELVG